MNNKIKIALALLVGGSLMLLSIKRKQRVKRKMFTAPDGNTYLENQIYRSIDDKFYKNGKPFTYKTPEMETTSAGYSSDISQSDYNNKSYKNINQDVNYHPKGHRNR
jgi:hypothetical protein